MGEGRASLHIPVLYNEILFGLRPLPGGRYVDGTVGAGGHAEGLLAASSPSGQLLGLDRDPAAIRLAQARLEQFGARCILVQCSYVEMRKEAAALGWESASGILLDLGLSSMQLEDAERGFSFQHDGPLDMRFDPSASVSAADLVNGLSQAELADLLFRLGEEWQARRVAREIVRARPVRGTAHLAEIVARAKGSRRGGVHPATKTFQALRIAVNEELEVLPEGLEVAARLLEAGGRLAVISFHSLEDRIVKQAFQRLAAGTASIEAGPGTPALGAFELVTKKPQRPGEKEIASNPRSRSAKLRIIEKNEPMA